MIRIMIKIPSNNYSCKAFALSRLLSQMSIQFVKAFLTHSDIIIKLLMRDLTEII